MRLDGSRVLIAGATGAVGGALAEALSGAGARLALAGRDGRRLEQLRHSLGAVPACTFEAYDLDGCAALPGWAHAELGGLDGVLYTAGSVAFGPAGELPDAVAEHLTAVNLAAPAALLRASLALVSPGGTLMAVTGVVAERPQPLMADYSASKAALSAWLSAVRREQRGRLHVMEARLGHLDTDFATRAVHGSPPALPPGECLEGAVAAVMEGLCTDAPLVGQGSR